MENYICERESVSVSGGLECLSFYNLRTHHYDAQRNLTSHIPSITEEIVVRESVIYMCNQTGYALCEFYLLTLGDENDDSGS